MADEQDNDTPEADDAPEQAPAAEAPQADGDVDQQPDAGRPPRPTPPRLTRRRGRRRRVPRRGTAGRRSTAGVPSPPPGERSRPRTPPPRPFAAGEARPSRSPEERHAERLAERRTKALRRRARRLQERAKAGERRAGKPAPEPLAPVHAPVEGKRRVRQGVVVSDKAQKMITVRIDVARPHRRYEKIVRSSSTVHAHDENNDAHEGDIVRVIESRPLSRTKRWALVDVLERAR